MAISLDSIRALDTNKEYYLANSTGEIKEATLWQKIKCLTGLGDGRTKAARLAAEIKAALLASAGRAQDNALNESMRTLNLKRSLSGRTIKSIARTFSMGNADRIASVDAARVSETLVRSSMSTLRSCLRMERGENRPDVVEVLRRAAKPLIDNPPKKEGDDGRMVLDEDAFTTSLKAALETVEGIVVRVSGSARLGHPKFDAAFRDHIFKTLYDANGVRNEKTIDDLLLPADVRCAYVQAKAREMRRNAVEPEGTAECIRRGVEVCDGDPDALDALGENAVRFLFDGSGRLRSSEDVERRVGNLKKNVGEMKRASGDIATFMAGKSMLAGLGGKVLSEGAISAMIEAAKAVNLSALLALRTASDAVSTHRAVLMLKKAVDGILAQACGSSGLDGQDEITPCRRFILATILNRMEMKDLRAAARALESPAAVSLGLFYSDISVEQQRLPQNDLKLAVRNAAGELAGALLGYMGEVNTAIQDALGVPRNPMSMIGTALNMRNPSARVIADEIVAEAKTIVAERREKFLHTVVKGDSAAAKLFRKAFSDFIGPEPNDPAELVSSSIARIAKAMLIHTILTNVPLILSGKESAFSKDCSRDMKFRLGGMPIGNNVGGAMDRVAQFVSGDKSKKFGTLDKAGKNKAAIVMGMLSQFAANALYIGTAILLDPKHDRAIFMLGGGVDWQFDFNVQMEDDGTVTLQFACFIRNVQFLHKGDLIESKKGAELKGKYEFSISGEEMDRLGALDFAALDLGEFTRIAGDPQVVENRYDKASEKIPKEFMINADCGNAEYTVDL